MEEAYSEQMEDKHDAPALRKSLDSLNKWAYNYQLVHDRINLTHQSDMLLAYQKLSDLIKPLHEDNKNKIALAFSSLRKGKKVRALVEDLKKHVDKSSALFMVSFSLKKINSASKI